MMTMTMMNFIFYIFMKSFLFINIFLLLDLFFSLSLETQNLNFQLSFQNSQPILIY